MKRPSTPSVLAGALAVLALGLVIVTWRQHRELSAARASALQLSTDLTAERAKTADVETRLHAAEAARIKLATTPLPAPAPAPSLPPRPDADRLARLDNPAVQTMMARNIRTGLDQSHGQLFRKLKLSHADLEKFKDLITERQMSAMDVMRAAQQKGASPADIHNLLTANQQEIDGNIQALLGDSGFSNYTDFNRNLGSYGMIDHIERRLSYTATPLEREQSEAVLRLLVKSSPPPAGASPFDSSAQVLSGGNPALAALNWTRITDDIIAESQTVLAPDQVEVLKQLQAEQLAQRAAIKASRPQPPRP